MKQYKSIAIALSVLIAVAIPVITAIKAHRTLLSAPVITVEVEPYDPRDLMYGHYMTFQMKWNWKGGKPDEKACEGGECCLCVEEGGNNPKVSLAQCKPAGEEKSACAYTIKGQYQGAERFDIGIDRYYVDEDFALPLEKLFRDKKEKFSIGLVMVPSKPVQEELYVGGISLPEYIEKNHEELLKEEEPATP